MLNIPTVWKELEKENKEFFEAYEKRRGEKAVQEGDKSTGSKTWVILNLNSSFQVNGVSSIAAAAAAAKTW